MRECDDAWAKLTPERRKSLLQLYYEWVRSLMDRRMMLSGSPLDGGGWLMRRPEGETSEVAVEPYTATSEVITGYFLLEAENDEEVRAVAAQCPALLHGETVLVRKLSDPDSHA
jgi:hypothetical protein